jgi:hypothetical protein
MAACRKCGHDPVADGVLIRDVLASAIKALLDDASELRVTRARMAEALESNDPTRIADAVRSYLGADHP